MHWLVFDTIDSIKEQDLHMNYFLLMHLQCIKMLYAKHMFDRKKYLIINILGDYILEPRHEVSNNVVCATSKGSDQPAQTRSLIRAFASHLNIL